MCRSSCRIVALGILLLGAGLWGTPARGQASTWDVGGGATLQDGSGTWDQGITSNWWGSSGGSTWSDGNDALFGVGNGRGAR